MRYSVKMIARAAIFVLGVFLAVGLSTAQTKSHKATPAESVVQRLQALISSGSVLTPKGWREAEKLFDHPGPYPNEGNIVVIYPGIVGEWPKGQEKRLGYQEGVAVESKWGSFYGTIDPKLRYRAPEYGTDLPTSEVYHLIRVDSE